MDGFFMSVLMLISVINYTLIASLMLVNVQMVYACRTYREQKIQHRKKNFPRDTGKRTKETVTTRISRYLIK
jgi:hypothetical protein